MHPYSSPILDRHKLHSVLGKHIQGQEAFSSEREIVWKSNLVHSLRLLMCGLMVHHWLEGSC